MLAVKLLPCAACGRHGPSNAHHRNCKTMGRKASDFETIPLCDEHHVSGGPGVAVHAGARAWRWNEADLLAETWHRLQGMGVVPADVPVGHPYHPVRRTISSFRVEA
jgi:hypothetical protein